jgi:DNA helicase-2/ATP-dependent DNA helicase PcrA
VPSPSSPDNILYKVPSLEQQAAIEAPTDRPVLVLASAGSGKTFCLTKRVHHLTQHGVRPERILVTTFTKRAAEEMRERLVPMIGRGQASKLFLGTIHAICLRILNETKGRYSLERAAGRKAPVRSAQLAPDWLLRSTVQKVFGPTRHGGAGWKKMPWGWPAGWIGRAKASLIWPEESLPWFTAQLALLQPRGEWQRPSDLDDLAHHLSTCYTQYDGKLSELGQMDFDDMLFLVGRGFRDLPEFASEWATRFSAVLVDEVQDTNSLCLEILTHMASVSRGLFLVGDNDQSLFSFNGATPEENIFGFQSAHTDGEVLKLETNYRSTQNIIATANKVVRGNYLLPDKTTDPARAPYMKTVVAAPGAAEGPVPFVEMFNSPGSEAEWVAELIQQDLENDRASPRDFFIVYRMNSQAEALENELLARDIPYIVRGGQSFYERSEFADVHAWLQFMDDPGNNDALLKIWNIPSSKFGADSHYFGREFAEKLRAIASQTNEPSLLKALYWARNDKQLPFTRMAAANDLFDLVEGSQHRQRQHGSTPGVLSDHFIYEAYLPWFLKERGSQRGAADEDEVANELQVVQSVIAKFGSVTALTAHVNRVREFQKKVASGLVEAVTLSTIHGIKGLEAKVVFGVGLNHGILPHARSTGGTQVEEGRDGLNRSVDLISENRSTIRDERCAAYVLVSRAREELLLSFVGGPKYLPSEFLYEMDLPSFRKIVEARRNTLTSEGPAEASMQHED